MDQPAFRIRKRTPQACRRCRRRKQRCIGVPTCANCDAANLPCARSETERPESAPERYHGMSKDALFSRIETLEAQLSAMPGGNSAPCRGENSQGHYSPGNGQFSNVVDCMTLGHVVGNEPAHLGSSSGKMIATSLDLMMKDAVWTNALSDASSREQWYGPSPNATQQHRIAPPTDIAGMKFLHAYFANLHQLVPFLDRAEIFQLHVKRNQLLALNSTKRWEAFKLFTVYAIGSAMQKTPDRYNSAAPEDLFRIALTFKDPVMQSRSIYCRS